jgi:hypothetical protein
MTPHTRSCLIGILCLLMAPWGCAVDYPGILGSGQSLFIGDSVSSPSGNVRLIFQSDTNLVLYRLGSPATPLWTYTTGALDGKSHPGYRSTTPINLAATQVQMQANGNLLITSGPYVVFSSQTTRHPGATLAVQDDGRIVISYHGKSLWSSNTDAILSPYVFGGPNYPVFGNALSSVLLPGESLQIGDFLISPYTPDAGTVPAPGVTYSYTVLTLQNDGNLVDYQTDGTNYTPLWSTLTGIIGRDQPDPSAHGNRLVMTADGDAQLIDDTENRLAWHSDTGGDPSDVFVLSYFSANRPDIIYANGAPSVRCLDKYLWDVTNTAKPYILTKNDLLVPGGYLRRVVAGTEYLLLLQNDGNLVYYQRQLSESSYHPLWSTITGLIGRSPISPGSGPDATGGEFGSNGFTYVLGNLASNRFTTTWTVPLQNSTSSFIYTIEISDQGVLQAIGLDYSIAWRYTD